MEEAKLEKEFPVVVIGGSAGSLEVIISTLTGLTNDAIAVIVVIHRKGALHSTLADVIGIKALLAVKEAEEKEVIQPGNVYLAPADYHLLIERDGSLSLDFSEKINFSLPSIDVTFECAAQVFGKRVTGILLSGGNADGVAGLKSIKKCGGVCVVQDPETAAVNFMPAHALSEVQVDHKLDASGMAEFLNSIA
jgi:two-component system, chemotaxis family, protein-glutamate methylesterase/glutaminase